MFFWRGCVLAAACHGPFFHLAVSISIELLPDPVWWDNQRPPFSQTPRDFPLSNRAYLYTSPFSFLFFFFSLTPRSSPNLFLKRKKKKEPHPSITPIAAVNRETWVCGCVGVCVKANGKNDNDNDNDNDDYNHNSNSNVDRSARIITAISFLWRMTSWHVFRRTTWISLRNEEA